jgi:hypothetical protein
VAGADAAATRTLAGLVEVGCRHPARLLVVHGAEIAHADRAVLFPAARRRWSGLRRRTCCSA